MRVRNWQRGSGKDAEGSADLVRIRPPVEESTGTALTEQPVLSARRWVLTMLALAGVSLLVMAASWRFGAEDIGFVDSARILFGALRYGETGIDSLGPSSVILLQVRLPRVLLGFMVGSCLAAVGVGLQALLRNPLADPYVLGISSGAALGAAVAMLVGFGKTVLALSAISFCAFLGGLSSLIVVYRIALSYGHLPIHTLLLAGVILNAIFSALIMFITSTMNPNRSFGMMSWLMGTLTAPDYPALIVLTVYLSVGGLILFMQTRALNIMTLGEESARSLGVEVERVKKTVFFTSALPFGATVP